MAVLRICAVRDAAIDAFGQPIFVRHVGEATRSFIDECNRAGAPFNAHPEDYELFQIGIFDDSNGSIQTVAPVSLLTGKTAKRNEE